MLHNIYIFIPQVHIFSFQMLVSGNYNEEALLKALTHNNI